MARFTAKKMNVWVTPNSMRANMVSYTFYLFNHKTLIKNYIDKETVAAFKFNEGQISRDEHASITRVIGLDHIINIFAI